MMGILKWIFFENFECSISENMLFVIFSASLGLLCFVSNRGDEVSMCHFKEIALWLKNIFVWHRGPKIDLKMS